MLVLPEARVSIAPRFAYESEINAVANDVANTPAVTKECNAIDSEGVESVVRIIKLLTVIYLCIYNALIIKVQ